MMEANEVVEEGCGGDFEEKNSEVLEEWGIEESGGKPVSKELEDDELVHELCRGLFSMCSFFNPYTLIV